MGSMLAQYDEDRRKERAVYYLSKKMTDYETRYTNFEKTCFAFIFYWASELIHRYAPNKQRLT